MCVGATGVLAGLLNGLDTTDERTALRPTPHSNIDAQSQRIETSWNTAHHTCGGCEPVRKDRRLKPCSYRTLTFVRMEPTG